MLVGLLRGAGFRLNWRVCEATEAKLAVNGQYILLLWIPGVAIESPHFTTEDKCHKQVAAGMNDLAFSTARIISFVQKNENLVTNCISCARNSIGLKIFVFFLSMVTLGLRILPNCRLAAQ